MHIDECYAGFTRYDVATQSLTIGGLGQRSYKTTIAEAGDSWKVTGFSHRFVGKTL